MLGAQHRVAEISSDGLSTTTSSTSHGGRNGGLRLGAALEQAALNEKTIDANAAAHALIIERSDERRVARQAPACAHWNK